MLKDRNESIHWARKILSNPDHYVILDTETTGLGQDDEVIQISIIGIDGSPILNSMVKCDRSIPRAATEVHGITKRQLKDAPTMADLFDRIHEATRGKVVIAYNAAFDGRLIQQSIGKVRTRNDSFKATFQCAMLAYSMFRGEWDERKNGYRWHKLKGDHSALGDCKATLVLIEEMAKAELADVPNETVCEKARSFVADHPRTAFALILAITLAIFFVWYTTSR